MPVHRTMFQRQDFHHSLSHRLILSQSRRPSSRPACRKLQRCSSPSGIHCHSRAADVHPTTSSHGHRHDASCRTRSDEVVFSSPGNRPFWYTGSSGRFYHSRLSVLSSSTNTALLTAFYRPKHFPCAAVLSKFGHSTPRVPGYVEQQ